MIKEVSEILTTCQEYQAQLLTFQGSPLTSDQEISFQSTNSSPYQVKFMFLRVHVYGSTQTDLLKSVKELFSDKAFVAQIFHHIRVSLMAQDPSKTRYWLTAMSLDKKARA